MTCELRVDRAAANLPQSTQSPIFTVSGGRVVLTALVGEVATAIQNQANTTSVYVNPTVGSDVQVWSLGSIEDRSAGEIFGFNQGGSAIDEASVVPFPLRPLVVPVGTIDLNCAASNTGQMRWTLTYRPFDPGAKVESA
jgi:hypothetical protein